MQHTPTMVSSGHPSPDWYCPSPEGIFGTFSQQNTVREFETLAYIPLQYLRLKDFIEYAGTFKAEGLIRISRTHFLDHD